MQIHSKSREFAHWPVAESPDGAVLEVSFDRGLNWHELTVEESDARILIAGPDATGNPNGTVVLAPGRNPVIIRATATPEVIYRDGDVIDVL